MAKLRSAKTARPRGVAAVELAIMLTFILVPLAFGISELGRAAYNYDTMAKSVRNAARLLSTKAPPDPADTVKRQTYEMEAKCLAISGSTQHSGSTCTNPVLFSGLAPANVAICDWRACAGTHALVDVVKSGVTYGQTNLFTVTVTNVQFTSLVPVVIPSFGFENVSATFSVRP